VEVLTEDELMLLKKFYVKLSKLAKTEEDLHTSHSPDEAHDYHERRKLPAAKDAEYQENHKLITYGNY
jgi:hypothetical protein